MRKHNHETNKAKGIENHDSEPPTKRSKLFSFIECDVQDHESESSSTEEEELQRYMDDQNIARMETSMFWKHNGSKYPFWLKWKEPRWMALLEMLIWTVPTSNWSLRSGWRKTNQYSLYCLGEEAEDIFLSMNITTNAERNYNQVLGKFNEFFKIRRNVIFERARFNQRKWQGIYIAVLYNLAGNCEHGALKNNMIRSRPVVEIWQSRHLEWL